MPEPDAEQRAEALRLAHERVKHLDPGSSPISAMSIVSRALLAAEAEVAYLSSRQVDFAATAEKDRDRAERAEAQTQECEQRLDAEIVAHGDTEARVKRLEEALREIEDLDDKTYYDDPVAGFAALARAALGGQK